LQLKVFFKAFPETAKCPSCGKVGTIRRSRARNIFENTIKYSGLASVYKCRECGWRGVLRRYTMNRYSFITLFFYAALVFIVAYIINAILQKNFNS
jgi:predicted RNA-binding Zn-ribbon protein involved in translation (DUF1610 family)